MCPTPAPKKRCMSHVSSVDTTTVDQTDTRSSGNISGPTSVLSSVDTTPVDQTDTRSSGNLSGPTSVLSSVDTTTVDQTDTRSSGNLYGPTSVSSSVDTTTVDQTETTDIGTYTNSSGNLATSISDHQKYRLLTKHDVPSSETDFPVEHKHGRCRTFKIHWLSRYKGLVYSCVLKGGMCLYCALFGKQQSAGVGVLVKRPYSGNFHKASDILGSHFGSAAGKGNAFHSDAVVAAMSFLRVMDGKQAPVNRQIDLALQERVKTNRAKLHLSSKPSYSVGDKIYLCGDIVMLANICT